MKNLYYFLLGIFIISLSTSCKDEGEAQVNYSLQSISSTGVINWDSCYINLVGVTFSGEQKGDEVTVFKSDTLRINLLQNDHLFAQMNIPEGKYKQVKASLRFYKDHPDNDAPIYLEGIYKDSPDEVPVQAMLFGEGFSVEINELTLKESDQKTGKITVNFEKLFTDISKPQLDSATRIGGAIIIAPDVNMPIYTKILDNLEGSVSISY